MQLCLHAGIASCPGLQNDVWTSANIDGGFAFLVARGLEDIGKTSHRRMSQTRLHGSSHGWADATTC